jgi:hypothetical protein
MAYLHECFTYDDGILIWKERPLHHFKYEFTRTYWNRRFAGKVAGIIQTQKRLHSIDQRCMININNKPYLRSILVWIYHGRELRGHLYIDHEDTDSLNDRIDNLRECTQSQNGGHRNLNANSKTGYKGVNYHEIYHRYEASIRFQGKRLLLGSFDTAEEAHQVRAAKARELFGEFANEG